MNSFLKFTSGTTALMVANILEFSPQFFIKRLGTPSYEMNALFADPATPRHKNKCRRLPFNHKELGSNLVQPRELRDVPSPVLGKAGDVVLFDTSAPHKAGTVADGHIRRVVRFDFEHWSFNSALRAKDRLRKLIPSFS